MRIKRSISAHAARLLVVILLVAGLITLGESTALACSRQAPRSIEEVAASTDGSIAGVYQFMTLARAPTMGWRYATTATILTRYWGDPPDSTGIDATGGELWPLYTWYGTGACGPGLQPPVGEIGYGITRSGGSGAHRFVETWVAIGESMFGGLSPSQVEALDDAFGPSTTIEVGVLDRFQAVVAVWWANLLALQVLAIPFFLILGWLRRRRVPDTSTPLPP